MSENRSSLFISQGDKDRINKAAQDFIREVEAILIALEPDDKKSMLKMSDRSIPFVEKALEYMKTDPDFMPRYVDAPEADKDFDSFSFLRSLYRLLAPLMENIDDTATLAGSDAMSAANAYYGGARDAAARGIPRAQVIYEDLSKRYEAQRTRLRKTTPNP